MSISLGLDDVRSRIRRAAERSGRGAEDIRLVAVTKGKQASAVREAYEAGQRDFGENYVQELVAKAQALGDLADLRWHMIGHLQTNKVRQVAQVVHMVQSVDSLRVGAELAKRAEQLARRIQVLAEINVGGEQQKTGAPQSEARDLVESLARERWLDLRGLMTVPPFDLGDSETSRYFDRLVSIQSELGGPLRLPELSMGMSNDFEVAVERGATMVRVGTLIFGAR